jgi:HK97 family phage major capsid protein
MANRILRPGVEGARLADSDRVTPTTGLVTLVTKLFKGEVPVTDELFEDNIERDRVADTLMEMIASAVGRDLEEIAIKSDTARTGGEVALFDQFDGIIKGLQSGLPTAQKLDATAVTTYDDLFANMVEALPVRYRRNYNNLRLYVPVRMKDGYQRSLAARGTGLGDQALINNLATQLAFRGIPVVDVPMLSGTDTINSGSVNYANFAFLYDPQNLIVGWHRRVRVERWRDPREGVTSFLPSLRYDVKFAVPDFGVLAYNVGSI